MASDRDFDGRRRSALAYWRYSHDYLRAARTLCMRHKLSCADVQANYHLAAQATEFALDAFLRAKGVPAESIEGEFRQALDRALEESRARGLPNPPHEVAAVIARLARHHQPGRFVHVLERPQEFPDLEPLFNATCWILSTIVPDVAGDYTTHYSDANSPSTEVFINRLRADLSATASSADAVLV